MASAEAGAFHTITIETVTADGVTVDETVLGVFAEDDDEDRVLDRLLDDRPDLLRLFALTVDQPDGGYDAVDALRFAHDRG